MELDSVEQIIASLPHAQIVHESIPPKAAGFLAEALDTQESPSACIMVAASAVDQMLKDKGFKSGKLNARIHEAVMSHLLTPEMGKWADDVRLDANDIRHADEEAMPFTKSEAKKCVDFALALAEYLFVLPARVDRAISRDVENK